MPELITEAWTPSPYRLRELCDGEVDGAALPEHVANAPEAFHFWRVRFAGDDKDSSLWACGVRTLPNGRARLWLSPQKGHCQVDSALAAARRTLVTNVHQSLAGLGVQQTQVILPAGGTDTWPSECGYESLTEMISMRQAPRVVRDVCPPPSGHQQCDAVRWEFQEAAVLDPASAHLFAATMVDQPEGVKALESLREIWPALEQPLCGTHSLGDAPSGLIVLETRHEVWEVRYLGVVPELRRGGQARCLLHQAALFAASRDVGEIQVWVDPANQPAISCYEQADYCVDDVWCCWRYQL